MYLLKRKIIAFILLLIVAIPVFLSFKFIVEEKMLESEVEEKFKSEKMQTVSIPVSSLFWVKKGKEVVIDGKLFDIKEMKVSNEIATLVGFFDMEETELQEEFKDIIESKENDSPFSELMIKFLISPFYSNPPEVNLRESWSYVSQQYRSFDEMIPVAPVLSFIQPPRL